MEALVCDLEAIVETILVDKGSDGAAGSMNWTSSTNPAPVFADEAADLTFSRLKIVSLLIEEVHLLKIHIDVMLLQVIP